MIKLSGNSPSIIYQIPTKSSVPDGNQIIKSDSSIFSTRRRLLWNGSISVVLAFDFDLDLHLPIKLSHNGITEGQSELEWVSEVKDDIEETVYSLSKNQLTDDKIIEDKVRSSIRSVTKLFFNINKYKFQVSRQIINYFHFLAETFSEANAWIYNNAFS